MRLTKKNLIKKDMTGVTMMHDHLLVEELRVKRHSSLGLLLPEEKWRRRAMVLASSADCPVQPGDEIIRNMGRGTPITINGQELEIIHLDWVMAKID